jgi:tetratricopeptide (TPR) repeat protein
VWSDVFDKAGLMVGKREEFAEVFKRGIQEQISYLFAALNEAGSFWIVLDNFEDLLNKDDLTIGEDKNDPVRNLLHHAFELAVNQRFVITTQRTPAFVGRNAPVLGEEHHIHVGGTPEDDAVRYLQEEGERFMLREVGERILRDFVRRVDCLPLVVVSLIRHLDKYFKRKPKGSIKRADVEKEINATGTYVETDKENGLRNWLTEQIIELPVDEKLVLSVLSVFREPCPKDALAFMLPNFSDDEIEEVLAQLERDRLLYQEGKGFQLSAIIRECVYNLIPKTATSEDDTFTQTALHTRAADFYASIRKPEEQWKTLEDLAPQFEEMYHCRQSRLYDRAAIVLDDEGNRFLQRAGYSRRMLTERQMLVGMPMLSGFLAYNLGWMAVAYGELGAFLDALKCNEESLELFRKIGDRENEGIMLGTLAGGYSYLGDYQKALGYLDDALKIHHEVGNRVSEGVVLGNIGSVYSTLGEKRRGIEYFEKALRIHREVGNKISEGIVLGNIGDTYSRLGEHQQALDYYEQALQIHREVGDRVGVGIVLGYKGTTKFVLGETEEGIRLVKQALEIARQVEDKRFEDIWLKKLKTMKAHSDDAT